jgi:CheY-like chemotaxis protein
VAPLLQRLQAAGARPARIVSDWRLEVGDGIAAIAALRQQAGRSLPALLLSGETLSVDAKALAAQRITVARKPLPAAALRAWLSVPEGPPPAIAPEAAPMLAALPVQPAPLDKAWPGA